MRLFIHSFFLVMFIYNCCALICRSGFGPKDEELRKVFNNCLKQQQGNNNENNKQSQDHNWKNREENRRNQWDMDNRSDNEDERSNNRYNGMQSRQRNNDNTKNNNDRNDNSQNNNNGNRRTDGKHNRNGGKEDNRGNVNGMKTGEKMDYNLNINNRERHDASGYRQHDQLSGKDEFLQSEEYGDATQINYYSSKPSRRYKREKRLEINSGQRSQYNPHSQKSSGYESGHSNEGRNSSDNSSKEVDKACALHCLLENLHMTGDSGMPDRYLVTHALTKDEKNEDLRDFLQESIEECFQILNNENMEDKCEFSKNLLTCLSEKGRANCDDWNGRSGFMF